MKIVFFGTPHIAAEILKSLINSRHQVIAVVTQPDRGSGRGKSVKFSAVKEVAMENDIPVYQYEKVAEKDALDEIEAMNADLHVVAAYAQKLPNRLLEMAPVGCINVHPSLLPKYRGAAPMMAAILNGDTVSGVTIMKMAEKMDAGDILLQREMEIASDETNTSIEEKSISLGCQLLLETIDGLENGTITPVPQDESQATYIRQMGKEAGLIDFSQEAVVIERKIRAYDPWPGTFTTLEGKTFKIMKAQVVSEELAPEQVKEDAESGEIAFSGKKNILIKTGQGYLSPLEVQLEGKRKMTIDEFLRGKKVEQGTKLG